MNQLIIASTLAFCSLTTLSAQESWEPGNASNITFRGIAHSENDHRFVAVGENEIWRTSAGTAALWARSETFDAQVSLNAVASDGDSFAAAGDGGLVLSSENGNFWSSSAIPTAADLTTIVHANGVWVTADSAGKVFQSTTPDGANFTMALTVQGIGWNDVTHGGGSWLVVGDAGHARVNGNLSTWQPVDLGIGSSDVHAAHYGNSNFVVATADGGISRSSDGTSWSQVANHPGIVFHDLGYANNTWLAVGEEPNGVFSRGVIFYSTDGAATWTQLNHSPDFPDPLHAIASGDGEAHAIGADGRNHFSYARCFVSPLARDVDINAGTVTFDVVSTASFATWNIATDDSWLTPDLPSNPNIGSGTWEVGFEALTGGGPRVGYATLNGETVAISQDPDYVIGGGGVPGAPPTPTITGFNPTSATSVEVLWTGGQGATFFNLRWSPGNGSMIVPHTELPALVEGLTPDVDYCFEVSAYNQSGNLGKQESAYSNPACYRTPLPAITGLSKDKEGQFSLGFIWNAHAGATDYEITRDDGMVDVTNTETYLDSALPDNGGCVTHRYSVVARLGNLRTFPATIELTTALADTFPLIASAQSQTAIHLNWGQVSRASRYVVEYRPSTSTSTDFLPLALLSSGEPSEYTHTELNADTRAVYRVRATGSNASGNLCASEHWTTTPNFIYTHPATPTPLEIENLSARSVVLTWPAISGENGFEIQQFVTFPADPNEVWRPVAAPKANVLEQTITGLVPGWEYNFRIRAGYPGGTTGFSNILTLIPPADPPSFATATPLSQTSIRIDWENVFGEKGYEIQRQFIGSAWFDNSTAADNIATYTDNTAHQGRGYRYRVRATLADDEATDWAYTEHVFSLPNAPNPGTATPESPSSLFLQWNSVTGADSYNIERYQARFDSWSVVGSSPGPVFLHENLSPATVYTYRIIAVNPGGESAPSASFSGRTMVDLSATNVTSTSVTLNWGNVPSAFGYRSGAKIASDTIWTQRSHAPATNSQTYSSLQPGTLYEFRIRADFSDGSTTTYYIITVATLPDSPATFTATYKLPDRATLTWSVVPGADSYRIQRRFDTSGDWSELAVPPGDNASYTDIDLPVGASYFYRIATIANGIQSADYKTSNLVAISPPIPPAPIVEEILTDLVKLVVEKPNGADRVEIQRRRSTQPASEFTTIGTLPANGSYSDTNAHFPRSYVYRLVAMYGKIASEPSPELQVTIPSYIEVWRRRFGSLEALGHAVNDADPDFDSVTNIREFLGGTDPLDGSDFPSTEFDGVERLGEPFMRIRNRITQKRLAVFWSVDGSSDLQYFSRLIGGMDFLPPGIGIEITPDPSNTDFWNYDVLVPLEPGGHPRYFVQESMSEN